jgi:hypothetical protein
MRAQLRLPDVLIRSTWKTVVELGWSGICIPVELGGLGLGVDYLVALGIAVGESLAAGPFWTNMALSPALQQFGVEDELIGEWLPAIASGELVMTSRCRVGDSDGVCALEHTSIANRALLIRFDTAAGVVRGEGSVVDLTVPGVLREEVRSFDPTAGAHRIGVSELPAVAVRTFAFETTHARFDRAAVPLRLFIAAQALGVAQRALQTAIEHVRTRRQFGRLVGSFQAVKHQLADVYVANEKARVLTRFAAGEAVAGVPEAAVDSHLAWIAATRAAIEASQTCLQAHGALGFAWEHPCHLFLKRAHSLAASFAGVLGSRRCVEQYVNDRATSGVSH